MKSGIYKLIIGNKFYIGSSINVLNRIKQHERCLIKKSHCNSHLQNSYNKHKKLDFEILEYCSKSKLIEREQYYIDTLKPAFNIRKIAENNLGVKHSFLSRLKKSKRVALKVNNVLVHIFSSIKQCAQELNLAYHIVYYSLVKDVKLKNYPEYKLELL